MPEITVEFQHHFVTLFGFIKSIKYGPIFFSPPFMACWIVCPSVWVMYLIHCNALMDCFCSGLYPFDSIKAIVSDWRKLVLNTRLQAEAIVIQRWNGSTPVISMELCRNLKQQRPVCLHRIYSRVSVYAGNGRVVLMTFIRLLEFCLKVL